MDDSGFQGALDAGLIADMHIALGILHPPRLSPDQFPSLARLGRAPARVRPFEALLDGHTLHGSMDIHVVSLCEWE